MLKIKILYTDGAIKEFTSKGTKCLERVYAFMDTEGSAHLVPYQNVKLITEKQIEEDGKR